MTKAPRTNLDRPARRVSDINAILARAGHGERLVKGEGYVYWTEGEAPDWSETSIYVYRLSDLTIREYLEDHMSRVCKHLEAK